MKKSIWATLYHKILTDDKPQPQSFNLRGPKAWCAWQLHKAIGGDKDDYKHGSKDMFEANPKTNKELSNDDLLTHCLGHFLST